MNKTILGFGYPENLIKEYKHWIVLIRSKQVTIGSLIIAAKSEATNLGALTKAEWEEFSQVTQETEQLLQKTLNAEKFNYLALMMVDPHVHFHLIPRYSEDVTVAGKKFKDVDWPSKTELKPIELTSKEFAEIKNKLSN